MLLAGIAYWEPLQLEEVMKRGVYLRLLYYHEHHIDGDAVYPDHPKQQLRRLVVDSLTSVRSLAQLAQTPATLEDLALGQLTRAVVEARCAIRVLRG